MKKFLLRVILYIGYLSLAGWLIIGLPALYRALMSSHHHPAKLESVSMYSYLNYVSGSIIYEIFTISIYSLMITCSVKGVMSIKKILGGEIPNKFDILYIALLAIASILFWVWMVTPYN
jgi:hypothetical protein